MKRYVAYSAVAVLIFGIVRKMTKTPVSEKSSFDEDPLAYQTKDYYND